MCRAFFDFHDICRSSTESLEPLAIKHLSTLFIRVIVSPDIQSTNGKPNKRFLFLKANFSPDEYPIVSQ